MWFSSRFLLKLYGTSLTLCECCHSTERHHFSEILTELRPRMDEKSVPLLIFVNKGIEIGTQALTLEIIADTCGSEFAKISTFIVSVDQNVGPNQMVIRFNSVGTLFCKRE